MKIKEKTIWLSLTGVIIFGLVVMTMSSSSMAAEPKYGGVINFLQTPNPHADPSTKVSGYWPGSLAYETLVDCDWKKGPVGTGQMQFSSDGCPDDSVMPLIVERWERPNLLTFIYYIRKGVHFWNKPPVNGRELTAEDYVFSLNHYQSNPKSAIYKKPGTPEAEKIQATALGKYKLQVKLPKIDDLQHMRRHGYDIRILPHELKEQDGNFDDLKNMVGTGAWEMVDYAVGTSVTYKKNENYWQSDPFNSDYKLPYADKLIGRIIPELSTQLAVLRAGKIDYLSFVTLDDGRSLLKTSPDLKYVKKLESRSHILFPRNDLKFWKDKRIRQALMLALDQPGILKDLYGGDGHLLTWPLYPEYTAMYTPLENLPESSRMLYEYHPEKAKKLLAAAGLPKGFQTEIMVTQEWADLMSIVAAQWQKIGVKTKIKVTEKAAFYSKLSSGTYPAMAFMTWGNQQPANALNYAYRNYPHPWNSGSVPPDPKIEQPFMDAMNTMDTAKSNAMIKEINLYAIEQVNYMPLPTPAMYTFWQPWFMNYKGVDILGGDDNLWGFLKYAWVNQKMKKKMGR